MVSGADGSLMYTYDGVENADYLGTSVSSLGDINQDGFDDFAIGSLRAMLFQRLDTGLVTVYSGVDGTPIYNWEGFTVADWFSFVAPYNLGDDNIPDVMVTARLGDLHAGGYDNSGTIYIFRGSDGTLATEIHPNNGFYGKAAISLGDINQDGTDDMLYTSSSAATSARAYTLTNPPLSPIVTSYTQGAGPFVYIHGSYLSSTIKVTFNGVEAMGYQIDNNNTVVAIRPLDVVSGPLCITTSVGTACTPTDYIAPPKLEEWIQGAGPFVTINGINLATTNLVTFNGVEAMGYEINSNSTVVAIRPLDVVSGPLCITTTVGTACTPMDYIP